MKNPIQHIADYKKGRSERPKQYVLPYGEQDPMDIISYADLEEQKNYLVMGDRYIRTLFISGYPYESELNWLDSLINFNHNADIVDTSIFVTSFNSSIDSAVIAT